MTLPSTLPGRLDEFLNRIARASLACGRKEPRRGAGDSYMCCCPAHEDRNPSLSVRLEGERVLLHCFAGCEPDDVAEAVGMPMEAFFADYRDEQRESRPRFAWNGNGELASVAAVEPRDEIHEALSEVVKGRIPLPPTLREFLALDYPPIQPILGPWASQQINLVFAPSGAGKTMFGLSMAYAMAEGQDWLGWEFTGEPRNVLYVDGEMAARMMQERFSGQLSDRLWIANIPGWWSDLGGEGLNLTTDAGQDILSVWVDAIGADVIILDNFMSLAWRDGTSFSSDEIWTPFKRWCVAERARDKCVIMVDHANVKGGVFGTKTKLNIMDLVAEMEPLDDDAGPLDEGPDQGSWVRLKFTKTRGCCDSSTIVNQRDVQIGPVGSPWNHRDVAEAFIQSIRDMRQSGMSIREIAQELEVSYSKVQRAWRNIQRGDSP